MKPFELFHEDGRTADIWACGQCRLVRKTRVEAEECCQILLCITCEKAPRDRGYSMCAPCVTQYHAERDQKKWDAAKKVPASEYTGWVFDDRTDTYHESVGYFLDEWVDVREPGCSAPHLYGCRTMKLEMDVDRWLENALEEHYEDAEATIPRSAIVELQKFVDAWAETHGPTSYIVDEGIAIVGPELVPPPEEESDDEK